MSLRARLAIFIAVLIAVAVLAQGAVGYKRFERLGLEEVDRILMNFVNDIAHRPRMDMRGGRFGRGDDGSKPSKPILQNLESGNRDLRVRVLQNEVEIREFGEAFPTGLNIPKQGIATSGQWRVVGLALSPELRMEGAFYLQEQQRNVQNYLQSLLLTVPLFAGLGALAAWLFSAAALTPLEVLISATTHVADSGDLSQRVPHRGGRGELERLSQTFNQMLERLQGFREREVGFTRTAAHEFRTPLTAMRAQLDAQAQGWATSDEALNTARDQVERMTKLSQALLMLAREGRAELSQLDLATLAKKIATERQASYIGADSVLFQGNPILLERALDNLLENAIKHAPNSSITVQLEHNPQMVNLSVTDTGSGIKPAALERAREAFYRAPGTKAYGSGLGLAVVERIASAHGGKMKLENIEPHGLKVTLELPCQTPII